MFLATLKLSNESLLVSLFSSKCELLSNCSDLLSKGCKKSLDLLWFKRPFTFLLELRLDLREPSLELRLSLCLDPAELKMTPSTDSFLAELTLLFCLSGVELRLLVSCTF